MKTDIQIAQSCKMKNIKQIAGSIGIDSKYLELYGNYKAKISLGLLEKMKNKKDGRLILVTATNPTPAGEGKTTTTIGLAQALCLTGQNASVVLREPSLGPVMGIKGGAAGGGYSQVVPMEDINLHFTGDMHAITAANNLLCASLDNHIHQGNSLGIDMRKIVIKRVLDTNDRALRNIVVGLGGKTNGFPREDGFSITVASEVMAVLCLASSLADLKERLGRMVIAYDYSDNPVTVFDLKVEGAMTLLLKDALKPNLIQTLEGTPAFMHGGPFANIAHGCNSILATKMALKLSDYTITEAGFGADLGAEKFLNIKCRYASLIPDAVVLVTTIRALKYNGGMKKEDLNNENADALIKGFPNLSRHIKNIKSFGIPVIVAVNTFSNDTKKECSIINECLTNMNVPFSFSNVFAKGGNGGVDLANKLVNMTKNSRPELSFTYSVNDKIQDKIMSIVKNIYGGKDVSYSKNAIKEINKIEKMGYGNLPICMAKTQYSLSDDPSLLGRPENFTVSVKNVSLSAGAGFIVVLTGNIMTMPGLPKTPSAEKIDINEKGIITGLF